MQILLQVGSCRNCQELDYENLLLLTTGDFIYCKRVSDENQCLNLLPIYYNPELQKDNKQVQVAIAKSKIVNFDYYAKLNDLLSRMDVNNPKL